MVGKFVLVVNAKGGCGATTLSVDLAGAIGRAKARVTVVDADLTGRRSVAELLDVARQLNANRSTTTHSVATAGGIDVIEVVEKYEDVAAIKLGELEAVASRVADIDGIVLVDVPRPLEHFVAPFVRRAQRAFILLEPDLLGVSAARTLVRDLTRFGIPLERLSLVLNDRHRQRAIEPRELERLLGIAIVATVPRSGDRRNYDRVLDGLAQRLIEMRDEVPFFRLPSLARFATPEGAMRRRRASDLVAAGNAADVSVEDVEKTRIGRRDRIRREISDSMLKRVDLVAASTGRADGEKFAKLRETIDKMIDEIVASRDDITDLSLQDRAEMKQEILDEQLGLGPLEDLMRDPAVTEIMVNGAKKIYVERGGKLTLSERAFHSEQHLRLVIERIVSPLGRHIDESSPMVDARLADGSRVNAVIEPLALKGATLTIRRFGTRRLELDDLVALGSMPAEVVPFVRALIQARVNVIVSGGTGSGKTTLLNILSGFIPEGDRIITIEDAAELLLAQEHVVSLESRPPNIEDRGAVTIRDLVRNALRMRPDRIVVGECRGGEAFDMLQAMNTGHDGSMTTLHANSPRDVLARLETLVLMAGFDLPIRAIREQIASAIDVVVQVDRLRDGTRRVTSISEVTGIKGDAVELHEVLKFQSFGVDASEKVVGSFVASSTGTRFLQRFEEMGVAYDPAPLMALRPAPAINARRALRDRRAAGAAASEAAALRIVEEIEQSEDQRLRASLVAP